MGDHEVTLQIEYDDVRMKTSLFLLVVDQHLER